MTDAAGTGADDAAALFPDVEENVRDPDTGETVRLTVREFRFSEGLKVRAQCRGLVAALAAWAADGGEAAEFDSIVAAHAETWLRLIGRAANRPEEWIGRLSDEDGTKLDEAMWEANGPFFVRRIMAAMRAETVASTLSELGGSSATSSPTATDGAPPTSPPA